MQQPKEPVLLCLPYIAPSKDSIVSKEFKRALQRSAIRAVTHQVKKGRFPHVSTLECVDCGKQAEHYEHRDYFRKLAVVPVCMSCNFLRGPALPLCFDDATDDITYTGLTPAERGRLGGLKSKGGRAKGPTKRRDVDYSALGKLGADKRWKNNGRK